MLSRLSAVGMLCDLPAVSLLLLLSCTVLADDVEYLQTGNQKQGYGNCPISDDCPRNNHAHCYKKATATRGCKGAWCKSYNRDGNEGVGAKLAPKSKDVKLKCHYFSGRRSEPEQGHDSNGGDPSSHELQYSDSLQDRPSGRRSKNCAVFRRRDVPQKNFCGITKSQVERLAGNLEGDASADDACWRRHCGGGGKWRPAWQSNKDYRNSHKCLNREMYRIADTCGKEPGKVRSARQDAFTQKMNACAKKHGAASFEALSKGLDPSTKMEDCKQAVSNDMMASRQPCNPNCIMPCCNKGLALSNPAASSSSDEEGASAILIVVIVLLCVCCIGAAGAAWYFFYKKQQGSINSAPEGASTPQVFPQTVQGFFAGMVPGAQEDEQRGSSEFDAAEMKMKSTKCPQSPWKFARETE